MMTHSETIVAQATPPGRGGVAVIRISGNKAKEIAEKITHKNLKPRYAIFSNFYDDQRNVIDNGIALLFSAPNSFTGEDVVELQCHGSPITTDILIKKIVDYGSRLAKPGEFSERAFLNGKIDLAQAEAIADLINSQTKAGAQAAINSLQGEFSKKINHTLEELIYLRTYVEAAIDFPDEEVDFLSDGKVTDLLQKLINQIKNILTTAKQGQLLQEGMSLVIVGKPNAGKSSLLNQLSGKDSAIVTEIAGTTRDVLREHIEIDGMPLHIIDTAGIRESTDIVEQEGIRRAKQEIEKADHVLIILDAQKIQNNVMNLENEVSFIARELLEKPHTIIFNKIDLLSKEVIDIEVAKHNYIKISAKTGEGIEELKKHLKKCMGYTDETEGIFSARRRHIIALEETLKYLLSGEEQLDTYHAGELLAEELYQAQNALGEITGKFSPDDLLGKIFSSFCIGK